MSDLTKIEIVIEQTVNGETTHLQMFDLFL